VLAVHLRAIQTFVHWRPLIHTDPERARTALAAFRFYVHHRDAKSQLKSARAALDGDEFGQTTLA
jgi:hypothetical protein